MSARPKSTHQSKCYISSSWSILGDPGTISRVGINGGESFQERARQPLRCYSTTHSNTCLWLFLWPIGGQHLWRCFRDLLIRGTYYLQTLLYALPLWLVQESFLAKRVFSETGAHKTEEIPKQLLSRSSVNFFRFFFNHLGFHSIAKIMFTFI